MPNNIDWKYIRQSLALIKGEVDKPRIMIGDFKILI